MRTIGIRIGTKEQLKKMLNEDDDAKSMDDIVNKLLDDAEHIEIDNTRVNIHIRDETLERLKGFKGHEFESYNSVLGRLLNQQ